jgi:type IX secretion system PorP/SprF family membrane protein
MFRNRPPILAFMLITLSSLEVVSQDHVPYSFHFLHPDLINPAISGSSFIPQACLTYQKQWIGIQQSPQTMVASGSIRIGNYDFYNPKQLINTTKLKSRERIGLGLSLFGDRNGPATSRGFNFSYAYHLPLEHARLSLGIAANGEQHILDETVFQPTYPGDPLLTEVRESYMMYNATVGAYYYSSGLFGGVAFHHIIPLEDKSQPGEKIRPDVVFHGGYLFSEFGRPKMEISFNLRYLELVRFEYDIHFRAYLREVHWIALSFRSYHALALHLGINIKNLYLAYSYEVNLSSMARYSLGTHAIHLGINLGMRRIKGF